MKSFVKKLFGFSKKSVIKEQSVPIRVDNPKYRKTIAKYRASIKRSGYRSIKLYKLLEDFGYKRRGSKNLFEIENVLRNHGLHCFPAVTSALKKR